MWKKLVASEDLIVQETKKDGLNVRIEARNNPEGWNIIKRYYAEDNGSSYIEDYYKPNIEEVKEVLKHIEQDILTRNQIRKIKDLKKSLDIDITRVYHEGNVEKWLFNVHSVNRPKKENPIKEDGSLIIKHGEEMEIDVMTKEKFRHFEEELLEVINEKLGLSNITDKDLIHNFYYYYDNTSYKTKQKRKVIPAVLIK